MNIRKNSFLNLEEINKLANGELQYTTTCESEEASKEEEPVICDLFQDDTEFGDDWVADRSYKVAELIAMRTIKRKAYHNFVLKQHKETSIIVK